MADKYGASQDDIRALQVQVDALDRLLTSEIGALGDRVKFALDGAERALAKAEETNETRFKSVNEFRSVLADQQRTLTTQTTFQSFQDQSNRDRAQLHDLYQELRVSMQSLVTGQDLDARLGALNAKTDAVVAANSLKIDSLATAISRQLILTLSTVVAILIAALVTLATRGHP